MTPGSPTTAGADLAKFGARLLLADSAIGPTDNGSISPYSVYSALAMTDAGARGATAAQLDAALGGNQQRQAGNITAVDDAVAKAIAASKRSDDRAIITEAANSLWPDKSLRVRQEFLRQLATGYGAQVHLADYANKPDAALEAINGWVKERTHGLIPKLLGPSEVNTQTKLELVNALYLKAAWQQAFDAPSRPAPFTTAAGRTVSLPYLRKSSGYPVARGAGWVSVSVPYVGRDMCMTIVLPDPGAFARVRGQLASVLGAATATEAAGHVQLSMPAFSINTRSPLVDPLRHLGIRQLFDGPVDLSGIAGAPGGLVVKSVVHQSVVRVDQNGTEAAAATGVGVEAGAAPGQINDVNVNRAFFFAIHDTTTRAPLFLGQIADPTVRS